MGLYQAKSADCNRHRLDQLRRFDDSTEDVPSATMGDALVRMSGVDLTSIHVIDTTTALKIFSEIGTDMTHFT